MLARSPVMVSMLFTHVRPLWEVPLSTMRGKVWIQIGPLLRLRQTFGTQKQQAKSSQRQKAKGPLT